MRFVATSMYNNASTVLFHFVTASARTPAQLIFCFRYLQPRVDPHYAMSLVRCQLSDPYYPIFVV